MGIVKNKEIEQSNGISSNQIAEPPVTIGGSSMSISLDSKGNYLQDERDKKGRFGKAGLSPDYQNKEMGVNPARIQS